MNDTALLRNRTFDELQLGASASLTRTVLEAGNMLAKQLIYLVADSPFDTSERTEHLP